MNPPAWISAKELAAQLGVDSDTVLRWRNHGLPTGEKIPEHMLRPHGKRWLFAAAAVQFIESEQARYASRSKRSKMPQDDLARPEVAASPSDVPNPLQCAAAVPPVSGQTPHCEVPASLRFDGRERLRLDECAAALRVTTQHLLNIAAQGAFAGVDGRRLLKLKPSQRMIPAPAWRAFIASRLTAAPKSHLQTPNS